MNRETKRMLQRQGEIGPDGQPIATPRSAPVRDAKRKRVTPREWLREVVAELRKVNWPTRDEVRKYSTVVFFTLMALIAMIFGLDWVFREAAVFLFQ